MLRLTVETSEDEAEFTLARGSTILLRTTDRVAMAELMLSLGIDNPLHLMQFAEEWRVLDIKEQQINPL